MRENGIEQVMAYVVVKESTGCWEWQAAMSRGTTPRVSWHGKTACATRIVLEHYIGTLPAGIDARRACRNLRCVNPDHLEPDIASPKIPKRPKPIPATCKRGHLMVGSNLYYAPGKHRPRCRTCALDRVHEHYDRVLAAAGKTRKRPPYPRGAQRGHCLRCGRPLAGDNLYTCMSRGKQHRTCRHCRNASQRAYCDRRRQQRLAERMREQWREGMERPAAISGSPPTGTMTGSRKWRPSG